MGEVMICFTPKSCTLHLIAILFASVPLEVKNISAGEQFKALATCLRAFSIAVRVVLPKEWIADGFPKCSFIKGIIAFNTSSLSGVVAALSKYTFININFIQNY
jgi:hypothetical protein